MIFGIIVYLLYILDAALDYYVWKTRTKSKLWIAFSCLMLVPPLFMNITGFFADIRNITRTVVSMWILWVFILQLICKIFIISALYIKDKRGKNFMPLAVILTILFAFIYIYGNFVSRCEIRVSTVEITSKDIPESFDGYKIAQFSDTHIGTMFLDRNLLSRVVDTINNLNPDITIQSGDLINVHVNELTQKVRETLSQIKSPVYYVFGNHDLGFYLKDTIEEPPILVVDSLKKIESQILNWRLLDNSREIIRRGSDSIILAGVRYPDNLNMHNSNNTCGGSDISKAMEGTSKRDYVVLVSHTPVLIDSLPEKSDAVDLMLSGHTHAMQLKIFNFCPPIQYKQPSGLYNVNGVTLYVNDGIGVVGHPFRFGAPPEVTLFILKKQR